MNLARPTSLPIGHRLPVDDGRSLVVQGMPLTSQYSSVYPCRWSDASPTSERVVAKVLHAHHVDGPLRERFQREVQILQRCESIARGVLPVLATGQAATPQGATPFYVTREVPDASPLGRSVTLRGRMLELIDALRIVRGLHAQGVVHRDLKPDNFLVDAQGRVSVIDFGSIGVQVEAPMLQTYAGSTTHLTPSYTVAYAPPEQRSGDRSGAHKHPKVDVFAMGMTIATLLWQGDPPHHADTIGHFARIPDRASQNPPRLAPLPPEAFDADLYPSVDRRLREALEAALALDPERRAESVNDLLSALLLAAGTCHPLVEVDPDHEDLQAAHDDFADTREGDVGAEGALELYPWQDAALKAWERAGRTGYVEAVTGAGKSHVAYEAIRRHLARGPRHNAVVLVPVLALASQWAKGLRTFLGGHADDIGRFDGGIKQTLADRRIVITTKNSLAKLHQASGDAIGPQTLLIADECHRYAGTVRIYEDGQELEQPNTYAQAVAALPCEARLGLSATIEKQEQVEQILRGEKVYALGLSEALTQELVAPIRLAFVRCSVDEPDLLESYEQLHRRLVDARRKMCHRHDLDPSDPNLMASASALRGRCPHAATYLGTHQALRELLSMAPGKFRALEQLAPAMRAAKRSLVFTERRAAGRQAAEVLTAQGLRAAYIDGDTRKQRTQHLDALRAATHLASRLEVIVAPQVLDEGVDVPNAAFGVVTSGSRSRRQMIQRLGRVLRKRPGKTARFVVLCARDTYEDPEGDGHEGFIREVLHVLPRGRAWDVFDAEDMAACLAWLDDSDLDGLENTDADEHVDEDEDEDEDAWRFAGARIWVKGGERGKNLWVEADDDDTLNDVLELFSEAGMEPYETKDGRWYLRRSDLGEDAYAALRAFQERGGIYSTTGRPS